MEYLNQISEYNLKNIISPDFSMFMGSIGYMLLILYVILSYSYFPSIWGCYSSYRHMTYFLHGSFIAFFMLSSYIIFIDKRKTKELVYILIFIFMISFIIGISNYVICNNKNKQISSALAYSSTLKNISNHYELKNELRLPVSRCVNYHNGEYIKSKNIICILEGCDNNVLCQEDGAKLVDFYYASSNQSCVIPMNLGNYVSSEMLRAVIIGGARFVDLDIYTNISKKGAYPIVKSHWGGKRALNYINLDECFSVISQEAFKRFTHEDPFFIHLNLKTYNLETFDRIAKQFVSIFPSDNLPDPKFNFKNTNIATQPICYFYNKVILIVSGDFGRSSLSEIVNVSTYNNKNGAIRSYKDVINYVDKNEEIYNNRNNFSIVVPNEYKMNTNPEKAWSLGNHFFMMNYGSLSNIMNSHNDFFKASSSIMKDFRFQRDNTRVDRILPEEPQNTVLKMST